MLKILSKYTILIVIFIIISCTSDSSDDNDNNTTDTNKTKETVVKDNVIQDYVIPKELDYYKQDGNIIYDKFYPIGWSVDGKFAYISEPADEATGFYLFEIKIIDVTNDNIVWSWKPKDSEEGDFKSTWENFYELFKKQLNSYNIKQINNFELGSSDFDNSGNDYSISMKTKSKTNGDYGFDVVTETYVNIESSKLGQKTVFAQIEKGYSMILAALVSGYIKSPFEDRIIIICKFERWGYEGPPNVMFFKLAGCDLGSGFTSKTES